MGSDQKRTKRHDHLRRLPPEYYRGQAYVHWSMTIQDRETGWLVPAFHYKFREILTHTTFRFGLCCPVYCCMPDHIHLLWAGLREDADQRLAAKYFRKQLNPVLADSGVRLQQQPFDHVLLEDERQRAGFEKLVEYIARNPERKALVGPGRFHEYPYTDCVIPGYPEVSFRQEDFWDHFWRIYFSLFEDGLTRGFVEPQPGH